MSKLTYKRYTKSSTETSNKTRDEDFSAGYSIQGPEGTGTGTSANESNKITQALLREYYDNKLDYLSDDSSDAPESTDVAAADSNSVIAAAESSDVIAAAASNVINVNISKNIPASKKKKKTKNPEVDKLLQKAIVTPTFETVQDVPSIESDKRLKLARKAERSKTKGSKWYGLPSTEVTEEIKRDLEIIKMRSVLDPKHFYKKNDLKVLPKYFQVGKVLDSPLDYYNSRLTRKERKTTIADELLADSEFRRYSKKKYQEIIQEKAKTHYKAWKQAKRMKKKKNK